MWYFVVESESYTLFKSTIRITDQGHIARLGCFIKYEYFYFILTNYISVLIVL